MAEGRDRDRAELASLGTDRLLDLFFHQIRNIWRVDGLYFLGIEKRSGAQAATDIDAECWSQMAELEAESLKRLLGIGDGLESMARALAMTSWALDHTDKELATTGEGVMFRVRSCRTQLVRVRKGLPVFPCKPVRSGYLEAFARSFGVALVRSKAPPDPQDGDLWCEWTFAATDRSKTGT